MTTNRMPKIDLELIREFLDGADFELVRGIVNLKTGELRASKPTLPKKIKIADSTSSYGYRYDYADEAGAKAGMTAYIWRHVAFDISPNEQHQCAPCTDSHYLPGRCGQERRGLEKHLMEVADIVVDSVPTEQWRSIRC